MMRAASRFPFGKLPACALVACGPTRDMKAGTALKKTAQHVDSHDAETSPAHEEVPVGVRLRHARMTRHLTLRELAAKAGCSESMVSKVENGRALPSLTTLHRICRVLDLTVGQLFAKLNEPPGVLTRAGERAVLDMHPLRPDSSIKLQVLIPFDPQNLLEGSILLIAPGSAPELISHQGEEVGYVIEGTLEITVGATKYVAHAGDSVHFRSEIPHGYRNPGPKPARVIVINTPPTF